MGDLSVDTDELSIQENILIVGAGAIGRGFLAPYFVKRGFTIHFIDVAPELVLKFADRTYPIYESAIALEDGYVMQQIPFAKCHLMAEASISLPTMHYIFFCVGVRELRGAAQIVHENLSDGNSLKAVYSVENDLGSVDVLRTIFSDQQSVYFGVPDVITSSTAPEELRKIDPLCVASEVGELFLQGPYLKSETETYTDAYVTTHWICKKYLHNTPHAAIAYLGVEKDYEFIHQATADADIYPVVLRLMESIRYLLHEEYGISMDFLSAYLDKEMKRFRNPRLFDPISRVARNPELKLQRDERIIHVANLLRASGRSTVDIARVIGAAFNYDLCDQFNDLKSRESESELLEKICGIEEHSVLGQQVLAGIKILS
ncbi:MAG: hypothetical protein V7727_08050 [Sneathiella sp.]